MQAEQIQELVQQSAAGHAEAFVALVQEFAPALRLALAAHLDQPSAMGTVEAVIWSAIRARLGEHLVEEPFAEWIQRLAVDPVTAHLNQADRRAIDLQDALAHLNIQACHDALRDGREREVDEVRGRFAALPEATRTLLQRRYRDHQRPCDIASSLMISEAELATTLAGARAACDWRQLAKPPAAGDRLVPPLIEDWLNGTIDVDSRSLLATNLGRDLERAAQFARQVRVHLVLGALLAPFGRNEAAALVRQSGLGMGDSGRVMMGASARAPGGMGDSGRVVMGASPRSAVPPRAPASDPRRLSRVGSGTGPTTVDDDRPARSSPLPWIIAGVMVVVGIAALVLTTSSGGSSRSLAPVVPSTTAVPASNPAPAVPVEPTSASRVPAAGGVLRVQPGFLDATPTQPKVVLVGVTGEGHAYTGMVCELRALVVGIPTTTEVEYWAGEQRLGSSKEVPFSVKWIPSRAGLVMVQARALIGSVTKMSSEPVPLSILTAYGTGQLTREWWGGLPGDHIAEGLAALTSTTAPAGRALESQFSAPQNWNDSYLQRLSAYLIPPLDGEYVFWICADDEAELWLSSDESREQRRRIAVSSCVGYQDWQRVDGQRSAAIRLRAGQRYYIEALHKEGGGDDHVRVGWQLPDGTLERPIPGAHLTPAPLAPTPTGPAVVPVAPIAAPTPTPVAEAALVLWDGETRAGGSGYASSGIAKLAGSGRDGGMGLQASLGTEVANLGWNWFSWSPDNAGSDLRTFQAISLWMRIDGANRPTHASLQFLSSPKQVQARSAVIDVAALVPQFADGQWHQLVIPFERLAAAGFDRAKVWEFNLKLQGRGTLASTVAFDDITALSLVPTVVAPVVAPPAPAAEIVRRPELMIWDGEGANGGAGYKGSGAAGQSPFEVIADQGHNGAGLRARLGGGNSATIGWNWHNWSADVPGTDISGYAGLTMWLRFTGPIAPANVVLRMSCSPREPSRQTRDVNLTARQARLMDGAWHQVVVPLAELVPAGHDFDLTRVWEVSLYLYGDAAIEGNIDIDEVGMVRSLVPPAAPTNPAAPWRVVRAINLGGEAVDIDGQRWQGHRQAETDGETPANAPQPGAWLSDLPWLRGVTAIDQIQRDRSMQTRPLTLNGKVHAKGLGVHANSEIVYALDGHPLGFTAEVGLDDETRAGGKVGEVIFQVWGDGTKLWDSGVVNNTMPAKTVAVSLVGRRELRLVVDANGDNSWDHADWCSARFMRAGGDDGVLMVKAGRRVTATFSPKPAVDPHVRPMLGSALVGTKEGGLSFAVRVPNGPSRVWLWLGEGGAANSHQFDLDVEGTLLAGVGALPADGWEKLGPIEVVVADGTVDVTAKAIRGLPQVMGILIEQPTSPAP